jgi:GTP-binding protein
VVGRPNVGKSTLINHFLGEERLITDDKPGTTRDAVDTTLRLGQREYLLIDTAGIRRRGKVQAPVEKYSVLRAHDAVRRSDLCLLMLDSREMVTDQDARIAGLIKEAGKGCLILVNKWDLVRDLDRKAAGNLIREAMPFIDYAPVLFISALKGKGTGEIFPEVDDIYQELTRTISTNVLNRFLAESTKAHKPSSHKGRPVTFSYMTQVRVNPPTFTILTNHPYRVHFTYRRYLVNRLREEFGFKGVSIVLRFRQKKGKPRKSS